MADGLTKYQSQRKVWLYRKQVESLLGCGRGAWLDHGITKLHDHLPVGGLCYIASIIWKVIAGMEEERLVPGL